MLWQKEKSLRNPWKISNDLTKKTMRLHENPSKSLSCNCWRKKTLKKITISELVAACRCISCGLLPQLWIKGRDFESPSFSLVSQRLPSLWTATTLRQTSTRSGFISLRKSKKKPKSSVLLLITILSRLLTKAVYDFLEKRNGSSSNGAGSYLNSFWSSAIVSVISKWVKDGMKTPAEKIAKLGLPLFPQKKK